MLICAVCFCMSDIYYNFNINKERFTLHNHRLVINILPGEFDPILSWPFKLFIRINVINLSEPNDTWTKIVDPKDNQNSACFLRPCTSYGNPSICFPFLIPHSQLFKSYSPFILNDTMFIDVNLEEST